MKRILGKLVLSAAVAATTLAAVPADAADNWRHGGRDRPAATVREDGAALLAAGIIGLAAGAIVAGIVNGAQNRPADAASYRHPQPRPQPDRDYFPPAPPAAQPTYDYVYGPRRIEPWSREWYRACGARYRSFDPSTGTYLTRGGQRFCVIG